LSFATGTPYKTFTKFRGLENYMKVAIIMGSDSDWPVMRAAADVLKEFNVDYQAKVVSAHRTPDDMMQFAKTAAEQGYNVIIAGAGGAAHLPGMVASNTTLPVIGVPVRGSSLDGLDSLLSIVQMPKGIPVATVAINNAANAALLAVRMLSIASDQLRAQLTEYADAMAEMSRCKTLDD
jgi:phosphoribosylaminoimidazole carboxylase PurE protein